MNDYVRRTLVYLNEKGELEHTSDLAIMDATKPVIVLGEPGMGKTWLLRRIAEELGWTFRSAVSFVTHPNPALLVPAGTKLVIDGLDELPAAQESDPVNRVLGQLIKAGCPPFILSCRAADWHGAVARQDISDGYGVSPREMTLEPFSREGAVETLAAALGPARAEEVVDYLEGKGIPDLYGNPLTLNLFAKVAANNRPLPETRAELMLYAAEIMWNERNDRHDKSPLSNLDQATALAAAGVASAALILTGSEAISLKPSSIDVPRTVHATELRSLPGGKEARVLVGSRLFSAVPDVPDQFKPIHRAVAEFLGARWLARSVIDEQMRDRILAMMTIDSGVPASLRGIHAWLAQDNLFAEAVIATDPYGVLRYGDADGLSVAQGRKLLHALKELQQSNLYFRAEDWGHHSAKGLTHLELLEDVRAILFASDTGYHLRTLLLEVIRGSKLAAALVDALYDIILQNDGRSFGFAERHEAAQAVIALGQDNANWPIIIERLNRMGDEDSTRLALNLMDDIGFEQLTAELIARAILAHLGLLDDSDADESVHSSLGTLPMAVRRIPAALVTPVLDVLAAYLPVRGPNGEHRTRSELSDIIILLVARQLEIEEPEPLRLLKWLRITQRHYGYSNDERNRVVSFLQEASEVRRAIQHQMIFVERDHDRPRNRTWRPSEVNPALSLGTDDVIHFLRLIEATEDRSDETIEIWRELAAFARRSDSRTDDIIKAAGLFARDNAELEAYLADLTIPIPKPAWEIQEEKRREHEILKIAEAWAQDRKDFADNEEALRIGELRWVYPASQAYLRPSNDLNHNLAPPDRIGQWLGPALQAAALVGFEAVLTRTDLPTLQQIADSYAKSERWNFVYPMIVGVVERIRTDRGLDDVPLDIVMAVRIALLNENFDKHNIDETALNQLDALLRRDPVSHACYARLMIEPSLERQKAHIKGLYHFVRDPSDRELARQFAVDWLERYPNMPPNIELELIDVLADADKYQVLQRIGRQRAEHGYVSEEHRRNWLAVDLLADFEATSSRIGNIAKEEHNFLWNLRHRLRGDSIHKRPMPSITAAALAWIVRQFRPLWSKRERPSSRAVSGDTNAWDATDFLSFLISRLERDPSEEAASELAKLVSDPEDDYTRVLRYSADHQRRVRREFLFQGVTLDRLKDVVEARPPETTDDLLAVVRYALKRLQKELRGNDTDSVGAYWRDNGEPRDEDRCTDALIDDIHRLLPPYGIGRTPQADMPSNKRADVIFTVGNAALPIECKGQWNRKLWSAASDQLDSLYLRDWRTQDRGIYLVYWFGPGVAPKHRLKPPPGGATQPTTPEELRQQLTDCLAPVRRGSIFIEVLDLTR